MIIVIIIMGSCVSCSDVPIIYHMPINEGLDYVRSTMTSLKKRSDFTTEAGEHELMFVRDCLHHHKEKFRGHDFNAEEPERRYVETMIDLGLVDDIVRITRAHTPAADRGGRRSIRCIDLCLNIIIKSTIFPKGFEQIKEAKYHADLCKLLDLASFHPRKNDNYATKDGDEFYDSDGYLDEHKLLEYKLQRERQSVAHLSLIILFILTQRFELRDEYRSIGAVRILDTYRKCADASLKRFGLLTFACVVTERDGDLMLLTDQAFSDLKVLLKRILEGKIGTTTSWSRHLKPDKIVDALNRLAVSDANKLKLAKLDFIPIYVSMLKHGASTEKELESVTKALWMLAFKVKDKLKSTPDCMDGEPILNFHICLKSLTRSLRKNM